ncbi:MAG TPA: phosphatidylglycerophosphatase A [Terriglobales bacterium]|nr:phosphatidylglycerophosphatase A [Terriglobales bacterium]
MIAATGGGVGYLPLIPGTAGTLIAVPISLGLNRLARDSPWLAAAVLALAIGCAIAVSNRACDILRQKDPQIIVIDEIIGFLVANFLSTTSLAVLLTSFLTFRFFDIAKVFPAARLEQLPRGAGVVLDDVMAGIYTFAIVQLLLCSGWL